MARAKARLGLGDEIELNQALAAIRRALDQRWLLEAEVLCRFILLWRPEQPDAWALRGEAALADGDWTSARLYFHEALRCLDQLPQTMDTRRQRHLYWRAIAQCNQRLNRRDDAENKGTPTYFSKTKNKGTPTYFLQNKGTPTYFT